MEYIVFIALPILSIPLALFLIFKPVMEDKKVRNNVTNSDPLTQHYCFVLDCDQSKAINQLSIHNARDTLKYTLDTDCLTIVFSRLGESIDHQLSFYVVENKTYLKVSRIKFMHSRSNIPLMINRFFIEKIGALPVDYTYFESTICSPPKRFRSSTPKRCFCIKTITILRQKDHICLL